MAALVVFALVVSAGTVWLYRSRRKIKSAAEKDAFDGAAQALVTQRKIEARVSELKAEVLSRANAIEKTRQDRR